MKRYGLFQIFGELRIFLCNYFIAYLPSHHIRLFYYKNVMGFKIKKGSSIHLGCKFSCTKNFSLGINSTINQNCHLDNRGGLFISDNVSISPKCSFLTADHLIDSISFEGRNRPINIENHAFLGFGATVLGGVIIKKGSVIGAQSLVLKNTDEFGIYFGVPAIKLKERNKNLNYTTSYRRLFN